MVSNTRNLPPLAVKCTQSDCENGLYCFKKSNGMTSGQTGQCRACGAVLVDWERVHQREVGDAAFTFQSLKYEWIRHHFWHEPIDDYADRHARRKGRLKLAEAVEKRVRSSVGKANHFRDGRQTPFEGNVIYYAQHALACCCRTCMEYWHNIPKGADLSVAEVDYFTRLIMMFIDERMPDLSEQGIRVPRRQSIKSSVDGSQFIPGKAQQ